MILKHAYKIILNTKGLFYFDKRCFIWSFYLKLLQSLNIALSIERGLPYNASVYYCNFF